MATNGIRAQVIDRILWVTQPAGSTGNYCGDPATGRPRAPLQLSGDSVFLTADTNRFYYEPVDTSPAELASAPIYARGGWPYVTLQRPERVTLTRGGHAYFLVAKYRCDGGVVHTARAIRISLPGTGGSIAITLRRSGVYELDYCRRYPGDRRVDPGNRVTVSPIEVTLRAALAGPA